MTEKQSSWRLWIAFGSVVLGLMLVDTAWDLYHRTTQPDVDSLVKSKFEEMSNKQGLYARSQGPERLAELEDLVKKFAPWNEDRAKVYEQIAAIHQRLLADDRKNDIDSETIKALAKSIQDLQKEIKSLKEGMDCWPQVAAYPRKRQQGEPDGQ